MSIPIVDPNPPGYVDFSTRSPGHFGKPFILSRIFDLLVKMIDVLQRSAAAQATRLNILTQWQKAYTDELNQIHAFVAGNGDQTGQVTTPNTYTLDTTDHGVSGNSDGQGGTVPDPYFGPGFVYSRDNHSVVVSGTHTLFNDNDLLAAGLLRFTRDYSGSTTYGYIGVQGSADNFKGAISGNTDDAIKARADMTTTNSTFTQQIQGNINIISNDAKALQANVNQSNDSVQAQADMATSILQQLSTILTAIYQGG